MRPLFLLPLTLLLGLTASCAGPRGVEHRPVPGAIGPYSGAVLCDSLVFLSGKIGSVRDGTFAAEAESALENVAAELARSGLNLGDVVSIQVYLTDIGRYSEFNRIYAERFPEPYPARTCVAVAALPGGARVEITATARR